MHPFDLCLVVKNGNGQYITGKYLNGSDGLYSFGPFSEAWIYGSSAAFTDAVEHGGKVFLRLPSGREFEVSESDFFPNG